MSRNLTAEVRERLIELAGRTTQDLGLGRIMGQVMGYVYVREDEPSLDDMVTDLGLSKAAVSIAARQLESLGLLERAWKKGERRHYYRLAGHFGMALQRGLFTTVRTKLRTIGVELDQAVEILSAGKAEGRDPELQFLKKRLLRAQRLGKRTSQILESPLMKLFGRTA